MNLIIGIVIVVGCVLGGFVAHGGNVFALYQPSELVIIGGAALGGFIVGNGMVMTKRAFVGVLGIMKGAKYGKKHYMDLLGLLYDLFNIARKDGVLGLEREIDDPKKSAVFKKHELTMKDHHAIEFIQDYLRMMVSGEMNPFQLENLMDVELQTLHHEQEQVAHSISKVADALPGFGIVAAVLGIVNTMSALGGPVTEIGHKVAAALVGTFLGILLAYGFVGPIANGIETRVKEEAVFFTVLKTCIIAMVQGYAPQIAVEFGRKVMPTSMRPSFIELEQHIRGKKSA
ncbi:MAG TPA: flagellar motor stator protein MotA [Steroidobacteraceae bacterium]|nr:flagellar motor stator protein MotA [Steroidobacteraceae bacterium]